MLKIKKIVCDGCGCKEAELYLNYGDGMVYFNRKGICTFSYDSNVEEGDILKDTNIELIEDYLGSCPECEDESSIHVYLKDGRVFSDDGNTLEDLVKLMIL